MQSVLIFFKLVHPYLLLYFLCYLNLLLMFWALVSYSLFHSIWRQLQVLQFWRISRLRAVPFFSWQSYCTRNPSMGAAINEKNEKEKSRDDTLNPLRWTTGTITRNVNKWTGFNKVWQQFARASHFLVHLYCRHRSDDDMKFPDASLYLNRESENTRRRIFFLLISVWYGLIIPIIGKFGYVWQIEFE